MNGNRRRRKQPPDAEHGLLKAFLLCRRYMAAVVSCIVQPHDVEDIVQETFLRSCEASRHTAIRHPRAFMLRTARNLALNHADRAGNRSANRVDLSELSSVLVDTRSAEEAADAQQRLLLFCRAVQRLPRQARRAFLLKKVYGLTRKEIAVHLGISESTVQKHITRGMLACEDYLRRTALPAQQRDSYATAGPDQAKKPGHG